MTVGSILEIYTTGYGWKFYGVLWSLFAGTGIALYPFMMMVYRNWRSPAENASAITTSEISSLQSMKWALGFKVAVLILAVVPLAGLDLTQLGYAKACGGTTGSEVTHGGTDTTWDDMQDPIPTAPNSEIKVPLLFHFIMQIASGINRAVIVNMPCMDGVADLNRQLANVVLDDPELKKEYSRFFSECYVRARNRLNEVLARKNGPFYNQVAAAIAANDYKPEEMLEMDSDLFRNTEGFYLQCSNTEVCGHSLQSLRPVDGFTPVTGNGERDAAMPDSQASLGAGHPYCGEWWDNLRPRLIDAAKLQSKITADEAVSTSVAENVAWLVNNIPNLFLSREEQEKLALRSLIRSNPPDFTGIYEGETSEYAEYMQRQSQAINTLGLDGIVGAASTLAGAIGLGALSLIPGAGDVSSAVASQLAGFYASLYVIKTAAPMMQALVLLMIYALLPVYLIVSEYKVESAITALVLVFVVKMFTLVFELAVYLENSTFIAMYPNMGTWGSMATMGINRLVLDMMLMMLYVVGPGLLLYLVTMAGQNISRTGGSGESGVGAAGGIGKGVGVGAGKGAANAGKALGGKNR